MVPCLVLPIFLQAAAPARVVRLSDAVEAARNNQPTVQQARSQTEAARGRNTQARQLFFPQITATASYQRVRTATFGARSGTAVSTGGGTPTAIAPSTDPGGIDIYTFGGSATQLLWDFRASYNRSRAAGRFVDASLANERVSEQTAVVDVRRSYFAARAQKALIVVAHDSLDNFQKHLVQIEGFVKVGTRPEIDLAQARTDVANARLALINAENAYAIAKAQLGQAMGLAQPSDFDVADEELSAVEGEDLATEQLVARAIEARPEVVVFEKQREANELTAQAFRGAYGPTLTAAGALSETGTELGNLGPAWNVGLTLSWPLFQGWLTHGQVREAEANAAAARAQMDAAKLQVRVDVEQAQLGIRAAKSSLVAANDAATNARERLRLAEGRYASGVGSAIELGDAQVAQTTAAAQIVQAQFNLSSARADLLNALGRR
jgi:outer membrane protein